jgi:hypothetical protein
VNGDIVQFQFVEVARGCAPRRHQKKRRHVNNHSPEDSTRLTRFLTVIKGGFRNRMFGSFGQLPAVFLGPPSVPPPASFLGPPSVPPPASVVGESAAAGRKRRFEGPVPFVGALTAKKILSGFGEQIVTSEHDFSNNGFLQEVQAPSTSVGAASALGRDPLLAPIRTGLTHRSTPAFERTPSFFESSSSSASSRSSPCPVCGEGYCPRQPCIAIGRMATEAGGCVGMTEDDGSSSPESHSAASPRGMTVSVAPPAAIVLRQALAAATGTFPWRSGLGGDLSLPVPPLGAAAAASAAAACAPAALPLRDVYAIVPYQPPQAHRPQPAPENGMGLLRGTQRREEVGRPANAAAAAGDMMTDEDLEL